MGTITFNADDLAATRTSLGLGTAATASTGTTNGTVPVIGSDGKLPSSVTNDTSSDLRLLALQVASDRIGLEDGIADPFSDETDIDTSTSTNEVHDSTTNSYSGKVNSTVAQGTGTAIGNTTEGGGLAAAFDGNTSQAYGASASRSSNSSFIGKDFGSGVTKTITSVQIFSSSSHNIQGSASTAVAATFTLQGSTDNFSSSTVDLGTGSLSLGAGDNGTLAATTLSPFRYVRVKIDTATGNLGVGEVIFTEQTINNMTLVSNAFTADSAPSSSVIGLQVVENEAITMNTDVTLEISRNDGSNFTAAPVTLKTNLAQSGTKYYESAAIDISGQPSGTAMRYRVKGLNNKNVEVHGVAFKWS
jgi:hypothetical protein